MTARAFLFNVAFYVVLALSLVAAIPAFAGRRVWAIRLLQAWGWVTIWMLRVIVGTRLELRGTANIPPGPLLVASKHQSAWDTIALPCLFDDPAMVLKKELTYIPLYGWFCLKFGMIPVDRGAGPSALRRLAQRARRAADMGRQIVIFPEGTRRAPGAEPAYKPGAALLYGELGLPCLPVALNSGLFWPRRSARRHPGTIVVEFLPPIPPGLPRREFHARLQRDIEQASARLVAEAAETCSLPRTRAEQAA